MYTQKEIAAFKRELSDLEAQRNALKEEIKNKRDGMAAKDITEKTEQLRGLNSSIDALNEKLKDVPAQEQRGGLMNLKVNEITQENFRSTTQYRDAFFRSFMNGKVAEADAEIMAFGKRAITDMNGLSVTSGAEYLVPQTTLNQIQSIIVKYGRLYAAITKFGFNGDVTIPIGTAGNPTNNADGTDTLNFTFTEVTINQQAVVATISVKNLLLKNSISGLEAYLAMEIGKYIGLQLENYILVGNPATSKFRGIITALVALGKGKTYSDMDWEKIAEVLGSLESPYGDEGTWIMNRKTFFSKFYSMTDANGQPLVSKTITVVGAKSKVQYFIDGFPVEFSTRMADNAFIFGDLSQYIVNESQELVIEADASAGFAADSTVWRGKVYAGGEILFVDSAFVYYTYQAA